MSLRGCCVDVDGVIMLLLFRMFDLFWFGLEQRSPWFARYGKRGERMSERIRAVDLAPSEKPVFSVLRQQRARHSHGRLLKKQPTLSKTRNLSCWPSLKGSPVFPQTVPGGARFFPWLRATKFYFFFQPCKVKISDLRKKFFVLKTFAQWNSDLRDQDRFIADHLIVQVKFRPKI